MRTLQEWMGHADIKTTLIYAHYAPNPNEVAMVNAAFAVVDDETDDKLSKTQLNSEQENPANPAVDNRPQPPFPGWGPDGRRFKSCLPDSSKGRIYGDFSRWGTRGKPWVRGRPRLMPAGRRSPGPRSPGPRAATC